MKFFFLLSIYLSQFLPGDNIYDLRVETCFGEFIPLSTFNGKMIMIVPFNPALPNNGTLNSLNSLRKKNSDSLIVIAVPALEYDSTTTLAALQQSIQSQKLSLIITKPLYVKRGSNDKQDPIFQWLTHVEQNTHFDEDASEGQYFVINNEGVLYAVMKNDASSVLVNDVVAHQYDEGAE